MMYSHHMFALPFTSNIISYSFFGHAMIVGKSSLLKRISARKIPGFPPHITSTLVPQEVFGHDDMTPIDILLENHRTMLEQSQSANTYSISQLEDEMDELDMESDDYQEKMEDICVGRCAISEGHPSGY